MKNSAVREPATTSDIPGEVADPSMPADETPSGTDDTHADDTDTAEARADDEAAPPPAEDTGTPRRWRRRGAVTLIAAVVVASLAANGWLGWQWKIQRDIDAASSQALDAATRYAVTLTSIDPNRIDQNFADVLNGATGQFTDVYSQSSAELRQLLIDNKASSQGTVTHAAVKSVTKNKVDVLLFVDQSVRNTANPQPRDDRSRVVITMERVDGLWLASNVELV